MRCVQESVCWTEPRWTILAAQVLQQTSFHNSGQKFWNSLKNLELIPISCGKANEPGTKSPGQPRGLEQGQRAVICGAASRLHLAPYCSHPLVAGCSHIRGTNSHVLLTHTLFFTANGTWMSEEVTERAQWGKGN